MHTPKLLLYNNKSPLPDLMGSRASLLKNRGYDVLSFVCPEDEDLIFQQIAGNGADMVLMEARLPYTNIYRFLRRLRSVQSNTCVILWGDNPDTDQIVSFLRAGVHDFLSVPFSDQRLVKMIRQGLRNRQKLLKILRLPEQLESVYQHVNEDRIRLKKLSDDFKCLYLMTQTLSASLDVEEIVQSHAACLKEIVAYDVASVILARGEETEIYAYPDQSPSLMKEFGKETIQRNGIFAEGGTSSLEGAVQKEGFEIAIPLMVMTEKIGMLKLSRFSGETFDDYQSKILAMVATPLALAIRNAEMYRQMQDLAVRDELTSTLNRRAFKKILDREFKRCRRYNVLLSLVLVDVDHFKEVNDRYGHLVGDQLLFGVASVLKKSIRDTDILFRYAGDEFVMILPETGRQKAVLTAKRVQQNIQAHPFSLGDQLLRATVSLGVASCPIASIKTPAEFFCAVDQALYEAKRKGRNRLELYTADTNNHDEVAENLSGRSITSPDGQRKNGVQSYAAD